MAKKTGSKATNKGRGAKTDKGAATEAAPTPSKTADADGFPDENEDIVSSDSSGETTVEADGDGDFSAEMNDVPPKDDERKPRHTSTSSGSSHVKRPSRDKRQAPKVNLPGKGVSVIPKAMQAGIPEEAPKREYWIGTLPDCPIKDAHIDGICFPRSTEIVTHSDGGRTSRSSQRGAVVALTDARVESIRKRLGTKLVRKLGSRGALVSTDSRTFNLAAGDEPLADYVYMMPVDSLGGNPQWRNGVPPSIAELEAAENE